jgi:hypothetical protein
MVCYLRTLDMASGALSSSHAGVLCAAAMMSTAGRVLSEKMDVLQLAFYTAPVSSCVLMPFFWLLEVRIHRSPSHIQATYRARAVHALCLQDRSRFTAGKMSSFIGRPGSLNSAYRARCGQNEIMRRLHVHAPTESLSACALICGLMLSASCPERHLCFCAEGQVPGVRTRERSSCGVNRAPGIHCCAGL